MLLLSFFFVNNALTGLKVFWSENYFLQKIYFLLSSYPSFSILVFNYPATQPLEKSFLFIERLFCLIF